MAYNLELADQLKQVLKDIPVIEKEMFGGAGFLEPDCQGR